jgi:two-component sensor histidine kinase
MMEEVFGILDRLPIGAFAVGADMRIAFWNHTMEAWTDIAAAEALGRGLNELFPGFGAPAIAKRLATVLEGGPPVVLSYQLHGNLFPKRRPSLVPRARQCAVSALPAIRGALFAVEDRTDVAAKSLEAREEIERRQETERELRTAIAEKDMLMREMNHRVMNNLNMTQSLISLGISSIEPGPPRDFLLALEARINSIAALHEALSKANTETELRADEYLAAIVDHLRGAFADARGSGAAVELELEPVTVPTKTALYLGLAANELVTNAFKYGGKRVRVALSHGEEGGLALTVSDDGPGFAGPIVPRPESLGLRMITMFVEQMGGEFSSRGDSGARFRIVLPL